MAPKRRAASSAKARVKKIKEEPEATPKDKFTSAKDALKATGLQAKSTRNPDSFCDLPGAVVGANKQTNILLLQCYIFVPNELIKTLIILYPYSKRFCFTQQVHKDYDCMLNQTNIGNNNNKFYVIQVLECDGKHYCWTRWGRVVSFFLFFSRHFA